MSMSIIFISKSKWQRNIVQRCARVGWSQTFINHCFYGIFTPFLPKISGKFKVKSQIYEIEGVSGCPIFFDGFPINNDLWIFSFVILISSQHLLGKRRQKLSVILVQFKVYIHKRFDNQAQFAPSEQKLRSPASTAEKGFMFGSGEDDFYSYKNKQTISFVFL